MKKVSKVLLSAMACMVLAVCLPMITKAAPTIPPEVYVPAYYSETSFYIGNLEKSTKITSVKSSNPAVAEFIQVVKFHDLNESNPSVTDGYRNESYYANIVMRLNKVGSTNVSYKIDGKKYTTKFVVKPYKNPVDTLTITSVNSGKNIAGGLNKNPYTYKKMAKDVSSVKIFIKLKSGCKLLYSDMYYDSTNSAYSASFNQPSKQTIVFGAAKKTEKVRIGFNIYDSNNHVYYWTYVYLNY